MMTHALCDFPFHCEQCFISSLSHIGHYPHRRYFGIANEIECTVVHKESVFCVPLWVHLPYEPERFSSLVAMGHIFLGPDKDKIFAEITQKGAQNHRLHRTIPIPVGGGPNGNIEITERPAEKRLQIGARFHIMDECLVHVEDKKGLHRHRNTREGYVLFIFCSVLSKKMQVGLIILAVLVLLFVGMYLYNRYSNNNNGENGKGCKGALCPIHPKSATAIKTATTQHFWTVGTSPGKLGGYVLMPTGSTERSMRSLWQLAPGTYTGNFYVQNVATGMYLSFQSASRKPLSPGGESLEELATLPLASDNEGKLYQQWVFNRHTDGGYTVNNMQATDIFIVEFNNKYYATSNPKYIAGGNQLFIVYNTLLPLDVPA